MTDSLTSLPPSYLIADVGHLSTTVFLFDVVADQYRLIAYAVAPTTTNSPWFNFTHGLRQAIRQIQERTGRPLLNQQDKLITPGQPGGGGVDQFAAVISAAPALTTVLVGLSESVSLISARRALAATYTREVETICLGDTRSEPEQIADVMAENPDLVMVVGGADGGADQRLLQFADTVSVALRLLSDGGDNNVLYAGNVNLRESIRQVMGEYAQVYTANNVRPALDVEELDDAAEILQRLYQRLKINSLPGAAEAQNWSESAPRATVEALTTITQYFAALQKGRVLTLDVGAAQVTAITANADACRVNVHSGLGMGTAIANLLRQKDLDYVSRWLPSEIEPESILDFVYNKSLYPGTTPMTEAELQLEQALVREVIRSAAQRDEETKPLPYRLLLIHGRPFSVISHPGQIAGMILDGLEPVGIFSMAYDQYGILPALGQLAMAQPTAAVQVLESEILRNLGWVVAPTGRGQQGQTVLNVEIEAGHQKYGGEVSYGSLEVFVLPEESQVTLQPSRRFDIGFGPGQGTTLTLQGGELGLVVDARGRPLNLPDDDVARRSLVRQWLYDLGG